MLSNAWSSYHPLFHTLAFFLWLRTRESINMDSCRRNDKHSFRGVADAAFQSLPGLARDNGNVAGLETLRSAIGDGAVLVKSC